MLTRLKVSAGACGFQTIIKAEKDGKYCVRIVLTSDCESVEELSVVLERNGTFQLKEIMAKGDEKNPIFRASSDVLPHSACPVRIAIIKAAEVELGLAVPRPVCMEFESESET